MILSKKIKSHALYKEWLKKNQDEKQKLLANFGKELKLNSEKLQFELLTIIEKINRECIDK